MCVAYYVLDLGGASCLTYRDGDCINDELEERSSSCSAGGGLAGDPGSRLPQDCVVQGAGGCRMVSAIHCLFERRCRQLVQRQNAHVHVSCI